MAEADVQLEQNANKCEPKPQRIKITRGSDESDKKEILNEKRGDTNDHPLSQWFMNFLRQLSR